MLKYFAVYLTFLITLLAIDLVWLLGIAKNLYRDEMGTLMATDPKLLAGLAFYVLYALGICIFVIIPALSKQSWVDAVQYGCQLLVMEWMVPTHKQLQNLTACLGYPILLSNGMYAVSSPNPYGC